MDVGANFYYYPDGNKLRNLSSSDDPTSGPDWSKGLFGGLPAMGYNMLRTMGVRSSGGAPTRDEISDGVRRYFSNAIEACLATWPELQNLHRLVAHAGHVGDPHLLRWDTPMVSPALPGFSFYPGSDDSFGQSGLRDALLNYRNRSNASLSYVVAESACFHCSTEGDWVRYFQSAFDATNPYGSVKYLRYYNIDAFLRSPSAVAGLHRYLDISSERASNLL